MRGTVKIEKGYEELFQFADSKRKFESISEYFGFPLGPDQRRRSKVSKKELTDNEGRPVSVYFKLYGYRRLKRALSRIFKPTRSQSEIKNLKFFHQLGIPACTPILQGEYRNIFGIARNCMIITKEIEGSIQLDQFITQLNASDEPEAIKASIRKQIIHSTATNLKKIHDHHFFHDDYKWRNILIKRTGTETVEVFWIDCPNGYFTKNKIRKNHGIIKDLACIDHGATGVIDKQERELFLSTYSGLPSTSPEFKSLAQQVVTYRQQKLE